jgi:hypothetical protein
MSAPLDDRAAMRAWLADVRTAIDDAIGAAPSRAVCRFPTFQRSRDYSEPSALEVWVQRELDRRGRR